MRQLSDFYNEVDVAKTKDLYMALFSHTMKPNPSLVEELTRLINLFYEHGYIETARLLEQARTVALLKEREILIPPATD